MTSDETLQQTFKSDRDVFLDKLSSYVILDIGTIDQVNENGRARVISSTFVNNKPVVYDDAEIIYPGNANGTFAASGRNMACLIFIPRSCMPDVDSLVLEIGKPSYNKDGVKAMPIGNSVANNVRMYYSDGGDLALLGQNYSIEYTDTTVVLQTSDSKTMVTLDGTGQMYVSRQTDLGSYYVNIEDGTVTKQWLSKDKDVLWTDTYNQDGSRSFVQSDPNDDEADPLFSMTIAADGTASVSMEKGLTLETKDALVLKGKTVEIDATDGTMTMSSTDTFSVNGTNLEVDSE